MLFAATCLGGFLLGAAIRRWWAIPAFAIPVGALAYWTFPDWKEDNVAGLIALLSFAFSATSVGLGWIVGKWVRGGFGPDPS